MGNSKARPIVADDKTVKDSYAALPVAVEGTREICVECVVEIPLLVLVDLEMAPESRVTDAVAAAKREAVELLMLPDQTSIDHAKIRVRSIKMEE